MVTVWACGSQRLGSSAVEQAQHAQERPPWGCLGMHLSAAVTGSELPQASLAAAMPALEPGKQGNSASLCHHESCCMSPHMS